MYLTFQTGVGNGRSLVQVYLAALRVLGAYHVLSKPHMAYLCFVIL